MRAFLKWSAFAAFWSAFAAAAGHAAWSVYRDAYGPHFWLCAVGLLACLVVALASSSGMWAPTSPRLGRKIMHDSGNFYVDVSVVRHSQSVFMARVVVYRDHVLYKSRVQTGDLTDHSEEALRAWLESCLKGHLAEASMRRAVRSRCASPINLMSTQGRRAGKIRDLIR